MWGASETHPAPNKPLDMPARSHQWQAMGYDCIWMYCADLARYTEDRMQSSCRGREELVGGLSSTQSIQAM